MTYAVEFTSDPAAFLALADDLLAADPVITTVVSSLTSRHRDQDAAGVARPQDRPVWWWVVRDAEDIAPRRTRPAAAGHPHDLDLAVEWCT